MVNLGNFNANDVEPAREMTVLPAGDYLAAIKATEDKATKAGTGSYVEFTFEVLEGEHKGRNLWARLNLSNPSTQAVQIAKGELSAICRAVGVMQPRDTQELHGIPLVISVVVKKRKDTGDLTNEIKAFKSRDQMSPSALPEGVTAPAGDDKPVWE